jgi:hypothetical protein
VVEASPLAGAFDIGSEILPDKPAIDAIAVTYRAAIGRVKLDLKSIIATLRISIP